jgi:tripartite-type tricarboxylate transporter receptor subunit TctC
MAALAGVAAAQTAYPEKPVRFVIGFPPGGAPDLTARVVGQALGDTWGKPVIVESMVGAGGGVAATHVAKAAPDGYTLLFSGDAALTTNVTLYDKLPYDPLKDFQPITLAVTATNILVVHPAVAARDVRELVDLAKAQPGKLNFASAGSGTSQHLAGELLKSMAGINIVHVPYKGPAGLQDVIAGRVTMMFANPVIAMSALREGRLRSLAVSSLQRSAAVPDLPTMAESGFPGFEAIAWFGLLAPAGVAEAIAGKLHADTVRVLQSAAVRERLAGAGLEIIGNSPAEFSARIREEIRRKGELIKASGAKPS